jgi:hypothetical protein
MNMIITKVEELDDAIIKLQSENQDAALWEAIGKLRAAIDGKDERITALRTELTDALNEIREALDKKAEMKSVRKLEMRLGA